MGNGEHVGVDCTCLDASQSHVGLIQTYNYEADVKEYTITGMEVSQHRIRYHSGYECSYTVLDDDVVFASREDAMAKAEILKAEHEVNEQLKLSQTKKDKLNKNWAWHVKYHKQCVERAEHDLEYHKMKLSIATTKVKDK